MNFDGFLTWSRDHVEQVLASSLEQNPTPAPRLHEAMAYSLLGGGKRVRATLVYASAQLLGLQRETVDTTAAAVEIIHAYSLIHDDLPAMDDDDLRRGKPSCHRAFDEATAILAGDALQSLAFELLAQPSELLHPGQQTAMIAKLAQAIGQQGMAAGQMIDLAANSTEMNLQNLETMHSLKTGALINACCSMPAVVAAADDKTTASLDAFSNALGLCFQIVDDILDVTASTDQLGKPCRSDEARSMPTYVTLLGLSGARAAARQSADDALLALQPFGDRALLLNQLVTYQLDRTH
ncbi:MAG TPA: geranyl transferase [Gammaproteobacteria bacterium]|nr:geranyl transferase [Gammaproteobacteria bacterium]